MFNGFRRPRAFALATPANDPAVDTGLARHDTGRAFVATQAQRQQQEVALAPFRF